ncbi:CDP-glycerol glycerophosphotransferase family protein [Candidatus Sororendozoicomonas aggregata]|uniref:CDP-glycerol glycerophosphotransferase family protein n=1 Tax=Candidatus Sororendozoicomonas aggregata TaxID=3073239 RepID=UPI002ED184E8
MVSNRCIWKLDNTFKLLLEHKRFNPIIAVVPYTYYGETVMKKEMTNTTAFFTEKGYPTVSSFDEGRWLDIRETLQPDIVFFTNPHAKTRPEYEIKSFLDTLTVYVPYHHQFCTHHGLQLDELFHNVTWKNFYVHPIIKTITSEAVMNKGRNVVITGFPGTELFYDKGYRPKDVWKIKDRRLKRVILAVHHTVKDDDGMALSTFVEHAQSYQQLAIDYKDRLQIAFKPHPILKNKLYEHPQWGKVRTDAYFTFWAEQENTQLEESAYEDLCLTSDGMIHDCGSFILEYLYLNKPVLYTGRAGVRERLNSLAQMAYDAHSKLEAQPFSAVKAFVDKVVIQGNDPMEQQRKQFRDAHLLPADGIIPSQKIVDYLTNTLSVNVSEKEGKAYDHRKKRANNG